MTGLKLATRKQSGYLWTTPERKRIVHRRKLPRNKYDLLATRGDKRKERGWELGVTFPQDHSAA